MESIPAEFQWIGGVAFAIAVAVFAAWSRVTGKKEGPPQPKVQEFYAAGQLADMGPVKELVEGVGLLVQQQIKANLALNRLADILDDQFEEARRDKEIAEEVARQLKDKR